jgi:7-cyano-7-deazaguanine tRNA-ribosyltransferase
MNRNSRRVSLPIATGTIAVVHDLRNRFFLPDHGLRDVPLMVSVADIGARPYLRRAILERGIKKHLGVHGPVMIDSGGFSTITGRAAITVKDLIELYPLLDADVFAALDVPATPTDSGAARARKWRRTVRYLDRLLAAFGDRRLMPVVHGRNLKEIAAACTDVRRRIARPVYVGLGGMVPFMRGLMSRRRFKYRLRSGAAGSGADFVVDALAVCRSEFPQSRLHVFGVGSPTTALALLSLGADSVDSLAWRRAAGYGTIFLTGCAERIISSTPRLRDSRPRLTPLDRVTLGKCECPVCGQSSDPEDRIDSLSTSYVARGVHNVWTLLTEQAGLRSAKAAGSLHAFLASRIHGRHRFSSLIGRVTDSAHQ